MKLYVINAPSYVMNHTSHTAGDVLIPMSDPRSEHFTYLYSNFIKFGLVDEVVIFPREGQHHNHKKEIISEFEVVDGKKIKLNWSTGDQMYDAVNKTKNDFVYINGLNTGYPNCSRFVDKFVMFNPMFNNISHPDYLNPKYHHYGLIEGSVFHSTVTKNIPFSVYHLTSRALSELAIDKIKNTEKEYDWIMVSSFDPRKRHVEFLQNLVRHPRFKDSKGCIVGRDPANKGRVSEHTHVYEAVKSITNSFDNVDLHVNVSLQHKTELMLKSKIFVCVSTLDNGPRAMVEAAQCGMPMLSMPHIGSADLILPGKTGELIKDVASSPSALFEMIDRFDHGQYEEVFNTLELLKPKNVFPKLIQRINNVKKTNKHKH